MSAVDAALDLMDAALFDQFGDAASVVRGAGAPVDVVVVLVRGVERLGEYGQVVGRVTTAAFRNIEWAPKPGDVLTVEGRDRTIESIDSDDGRVSVAVLFGATHG